MQKKVLALHDLSGFGRSSLVPIIAVLSAAGHQCVPLPTAVFSTHTAIPGWVTTDLTNAMVPTIEQYAQLGLTFDAVYAGFLGGAQQIDSVMLAAKRLRSAQSITLIDPVMGDNGIIYETYTPKLCARMGELCAIADVITPNPTEAAVLLGRTPQQTPENEEQALEWMSQLHRRFGAAVVLTGLEYEDDAVGTGCFDGTSSEIYLQQKVGCYFPGTGDLFASVLLAKMLCGQSLTQAYRAAAEFTRDCIVYTAEQGGEPDFGVQFESLLSKLTSEGGAVSNGV